MCYLYVLLLKKNKLYKGSTNDIKRRLNEHNLGKVSATKHLLPAKLIHYECYACKSDAIRREKYLKTTKGRRFLKQQLRDLFLNLKIGE